MGTWDSKPWENDGGADWYGDMFDAIPLAQYVEKALQSHSDDRYEETRAAASVLVLLGHTYIWPVDDLDRHLAMAARRLEQILASGVYEESAEIQDMIAAEAAELRSRIREAPAPDPAKGSEPSRRWWEFWK